MLGGAPPRAIAAVLVGIPGVVIPTRGSDARVVIRRADPAWLYLGAGFL